MPASDQPRLSVVIPAFNNGAMLDVTLDALVRQTMPAGEFEVIVSDDGSPVPLAPVVDKYADRLDVTCIRSEQNRGRSANRNTAAARARADVVVFLDADTVAHPELLARHWAFHSRRPGRPGVLLARRFDIDWAGADALRRGEPVVPAMVDSYRADPRDVDWTIAEHRRDFNRAPWVFGFGHNTSMDRVTFDEVGGFDEAMVKWGLEDTELFYRIFHHHGEPEDLFEFDSEALSYHLPHFRMTQDALAVVDNLKYVRLKHPRYDIEALYGQHTAGEYVGRIRLYGDAIAACGRERLGRASRLPSAVRDAVAGSRTLVIGHGLAGLVLGDGSQAFDHGAPASETNWHMIGLVLQSFKTGQFDLLVNIDLWRFFTPEDLCLFATRSLRKADEIQLVATGTGPDPVSMLPLPFIADFAYVAQMLRAHLKVDMATYGEATVLAIR